MINTLIGDIGHLSVIIAFVAAIVSSYAYFMASRATIDAEAINKWRHFARGAFYVHTAAVLLVIFALFNISISQLFERLVIIGKQFNRFL